MNIFSKKQRWKLLLFIFAVIIVAVTLIYSDFLVKKIASEERAKITIWADAIQKKASLVRYTDGLFEKLKEDERKKVELWADATKHLIEAGISEDVTFYSKIIQENTNIPVIITDDKYNILEYRNIEINSDSLKVLKADLLKEFSVHQPIEEVIGQKKNLLFYKDSKIFSELKNVLNDLIKSFMSEVVVNSASVPVIITDSSRTKIIKYGNIDSLKIKDSVFVKRLISSMESQNQPIEINLSEREKNYIYYENSALLTRLRYFPYVQFGIIGIFLLIAYILFSTSRNLEQNQVWAGMAKETAHQLGTPLSSLIAWIELMKLKNIELEKTQEIEKDIVRLEIIAQRFSKIGSIPKLVPEDLIVVLNNTIEYLKTRISKKIKIRVNFNGYQQIIVPLSKYLFDWVIENLCKNAVDSMGGEGTITIEVNQDKKHVFIDISDTGKGITKSNFKTIFNPGYTTKQRGWGLGLSLSERIIKKNHFGKIFVKQSIIDKGSIFRIVLNKQLKDKNWRFIKKSL